MAVEIETPLMRIRADLRISREKVARRTDLSIGTLRNAERGQRIAYCNALQILEAINALLLERDLPQKTLEDLGLSLY